MRSKIVVLHPGAMGAAVGAQAVAAGHQVFWVPAGRGPATRARAEAAGLKPLNDLADAGLILSVCPPAAAVDVAGEVAASGFRGVFVDANAISPATASAVAGQFGSGVEVVDGGIAGPPPRKPGTTRLYLSGPQAAAARTAAIFAGTALDVAVLPGPIGQASALKLAYASFNKLTYALAAQSSAFAEAHGVLPELRKLAAETLPGTPLADPAQLVTGGPRAWRWAPEMHEIADAFAAAGLAAESPLAAEQIFLRWAAYKDDSSVSLDQLLAALRPDA